MIIAVKKSVVAIRILAILIFSLLLILISYLFYWSGIKNSGLCNSDEGYYIQIVRTYSCSFKYVKDFIFGHRNMLSLQEYLIHNGGPFFHSARQGYILLTSVFLSPVLKDYYYGLQWSALFGILSVFLLYFFTLRNFGAISAFISTSLFALSSIYIAFARSVHPLTMTIFFILGGIIFYFESFNNKRFLKLAALSFGIAFSCHYNILWIFPVVLAVEVYTYRKRRDFARIKTLIIFSALPLLVIEVFTLFIRLALQNQDYFKTLTASGKVGYLDYFSDLFYQFVTFRGYSEVDSANFFYYFSLFTEQHSLVFVIFVAFIPALILNKFLKERDARDLFLLLLFLPFLFYSLIPNKADKMVVPFIPIFCIYFGLAPLFMKNKLKYLIVIPFFFCIFYQVEMSKRCLKYTMDISGAVDYMRQNQGIKHLSSKMFISQAYVSKPNALDDFFHLGPTDGESGKATVCLEKLESLYKGGFHYYLSFYDGNHELAKIARNLKPEATFYKYYNVEGHYGRIPNLVNDFPRKAVEIYDVKKIIDYLKRLHNKC